MLGYGVAGAVSPYLGVVLRDRDARLPFVISSVVLLITALPCPGSSAVFAQNVSFRDRPAAVTKPLGKVPMVSSVRVNYPRPGLSAAIFPSTARRSSCALQKPAICNG